MRTSALALAEELREHVDLAQAGLQNDDPKSVLRPHSYWGQKEIPVEQVEEFLRLVQGSLRHLIAAIRENDNPGGTQ